MKSTARQWLLEGIPAWARSALYLQFAASTFSIAGTGLAHAMMLLGFAGYRPLRPVRAWLPAWVMTPLLAVLGSAVLSALINAAPADYFRLVGEDYRIYTVPFLVLFALQ